MTYNLEIMFEVEEKDYKGKSKKQHKLSAWRNAGGSNLSVLRGKKVKVREENSN